ncbi:HU family DNA-binding protein [Leptolyngbyaceae cyanobacterium UHCC 1019]
MNKAELVAAAAISADTTQTQTTKVLDALLAHIQAAIVRGDKVTLVGFGTFEPQHRKEREGRNPRTGEAITIPATTVPVFHAGEPFKKAVSGKE